MEEFINFLKKYNKDDKKLHLSVVINSACNCDQFQLGSHEYKVCKILNQEK